MLSQSVFRLFVTAVAVTGMFAGTCQAGFLTETHSIVGSGDAPFPTYQSIPYSQLLSFSKFNIAGQELVSVKVILDTKGEATGSLKNKSTTTPATFDVKTTVATTLGSTDVAISALVGTLGGSISQQHSYLVNPGPAFTYSYTIPPASSTTTVTAPGDLALFAGPGTFDFKVAGNGSIDVQAPVNTVVDTSAFAWAEVTVIYEYTATDPGVIVPEPSSMALAAVGVLGLFAARVRRRVS